eukprot:2648351-Alexandrium_andersonii.AAC.1
MPTPPTLNTFVASGNVLEASIVDGKPPRMDSLLAQLAFPHPVAPPHFRCSQFPPHVGWQ